MTNGKKNIKAVSKIEVAAFLREVADTLEKGEKPSTLLDPLECRDFKSLEIEIKQKKAGSYNFKIKSKPALSGIILSQKQAMDNSDKKPKYKKLKKIMEKEFRQIHDSLTMNRLPNEELTRSFMENSSLMLSYEKHSGIYDSPYGSACERFRKAVNEKDMLSVKAIYKELNQIKIDCHEKYK